jgi:hypothetical protein
MEIVASRDEGLPAAADLLDGPAPGEPLAELASAARGAQAPALEKQVHDGRRVDALGSTGASSSRTTRRRCMLRPGRLHEPAHLLAELGQALLGLGGPRELLGREHGADLERGLRAVLRELVAELTDAAELRLQVGRLERAWSQQLGAQLLLAWRSCSMSGLVAARCADRIPRTFACCSGVRLAARIISHSSPSARPMASRIPPSGAPGPGGGDWARAAVAVEATRSAAAIVRVVRVFFMALLR